MHLFILSKLVDKIINKLTVFKMFFFNYSNLMICIEDFVFNFNK